MKIVDYRIDVFPGNVSVALKNEEGRTYIENIYTIGELINSYDEALEYAKEVVEDLKEEYGKIEHKDDLVDELAVIYSTKGIY